MRIEIDYSSMLPFVGRTGKPMAVIENLEEVCRRLGVELRFNEYTHEVEASRAGELVEKAWLHSECNKFRLPVVNRARFIRYLATAKPYMPQVDQHVTPTHFELVMLRELDWESPMSQWKYRTASEVVKDIFGRRATHSDRMRAALMIRRRNGNQSKRTGYARFLLTPPRVRERIEYVSAAV